LVGIDRHATIELYLHIVRELLGMLVSHNGASAALVNQNSKTIEINELSTENARKMNSQLFLLIPTESLAPLVLKLSG